MWPEAFRWTAASGMLGMGFLPGDGNSTAAAVSGDGSVIIGGSNAVGVFSLGHAFRWTADSGMVALGSGSPLAGSADGSVVVGTRDGFPGHAFRWTAASGMVDLGDRADSTGSHAYGVSADGTTIVGFCSRNGKEEAFVAIIPGLAPPPFTRWIGGFPLSASDAAADADPDGDGLPNAVEYILGGNPVQPAVSPRPAATLTGDAMVFTFHAWTSRKRTRPSPSKPVWTW